MSFKELAKIRSVKLGLGGYQDAMFGFSFTFFNEVNSTGVSDFWGVWQDGPGLGSKWTERDRAEDLAAKALKVMKLLKDAKVDNLDDLKGIPVELTFDGESAAGARLNSWRILKEVI